MTDILAIQILDRIKDVLNTDRPTTVPEVTKRRIYPNEVPTGASVGLFLGDEAIDAPHGSSNIDSIARRRISVGVQVVGVTDNVEDLDASVQDGLAWATACLGQTTLDGLVHYVRETATVRVAHHANLHVLVATAIYDVSYHTRRNNQRSK